MKRYFFAILLTLLFASPVWGVIAHDASTTQASVGSVTTLSWSHTVGSCAECLLTVSCGVSGGTTITGITYNSVAMTSYGSIQHSGAANYSALWRLVAPTAGANTVDVTLGSAQIVVCVATSYSGVNQTTPFRGAAVTAEATGVSSFSQNVSSASNDLVVDVVTIRDGATALTVDASQAERGNITDGTTYIKTGASSEAGAGTVAMSWTSGANRDWTGVAGSLQPAASARRPIAPIIFQ